MARVVNKTMTSGHKNIDNNFFLLSKHLMDLLGCLNKYKIKNRFLSSSLLAAKIYNTVVSVKCIYENGAISFIHLEDGAV
jgi:hypothetical protein